MKLTLPLPPAALHAHAKGHWRAKTKPTRECRARACVEAKLQGHTALERGIVTLDFYFPNRRNRDLFNMAQACKPYIDGIVDAGVLPDDGWKYLTVGHIRPHIDKANPRVEITITAASAAGSEAG